MQSQIRRAFKQALENARLYNLVAWAHLPKLLSCYVFEGIGEYGNRVISGYQLFNPSTLQPFNDKNKVDCFAPLAMTRVVTLSVAKSRMVLEFAMMGLSGLLRSACNDGNCNALIRLFTYSPIHFKKEVSA